MEELKKALLEIIAIWFIWVAILYGRPDAFIYEIFTKGFALQFLLGIYCFVMSLVLCCNWFV